MPLISQSEALDALTPHIDGLFTVATAPWDHYHGLMPKELLVVFGRRTRASGVHDLMVREATQYCLSAEGVRPFERNLMRGIVIDERIAIRFKKLDEEGQSRGHYTKQVEEYRAQRELDGIDAAHHLELGYVLNEDETDIAEVRIVCPSGRGVAWWSKLDATGIQPVVLDLFPAPIEPTSDGGAIIKPREKGIVVPIRGKSDEG